MPTDTSLFSGAVVVVGLVAAGVVGAQPRAELGAPAELKAGDRASIELRVWAPPELPLMATPRSEGAAVEVVRGRLLRADAEDPEASPLVFRIPIVAREPGPARVTVTIDTYACEGNDCRRVRNEAEVELRVDRAR
jgi:hypothetical protein